MQHTHRLFPAALLALACAPAAGVDIQVTSTSDLPGQAGQCTLYAAFEAATSGFANNACAAGSGQSNDLAAAPLDRIILPPGVTITYAAGIDNADTGAALPLLERVRVEIVGNGSTIQRGTTNCVVDQARAGHEFRLLAARNAHLTVRDLTLRHGCADYGFRNASGAIVQRPGGGAILATGSAPGAALQLHHVHLVGNRADPTGGAVEATVSSVRITDSRVEGNRAEQFGGGLSVFAGSLLVERSTIDGNIAEISGGGVRADVTSARIVNATFSGNTVLATSNGGAALALRSLSIQSPLDLVHTTFADNLGPGAAAAFFVLGFSTPRLQGLWMTGNSGQNCALLDSAFVLAGRNLSDDGSCPGFDPVAPGGIEPLADHGGPWPTRRPQPGSAAIDVSPLCTEAVSGAPIGVDARGVARPSPGSIGAVPQCDAGAVEYRVNQPPLIATPSGTQVGITGQKLPIPGLALDDPDDRGQAMRLRLELAQGRLQPFVPTGSVCSISTPAAGTTWQCAGPLPPLDVLLRELTYAPADGFLGDDTLTIVVEDLDTSGDDGQSQFAVATVPIRVVALAPMVAFGPPLLEFGPVLVGTEAPVQRMLLRNDGNLTLSGIAIAPPPSAEFKIAHDCPPALGPGSACALDVRFRPLVPGRRKGSLLVTSNAEGSPHAASLGGTGLDPQILASGFEDR
jgi:hypothetical protein